MQIEAIDHVMLPVRSAEAVTAFERLGVRVSPPVRQPALGLETRAWVAGGPPNAFSVQFMTLVDRTAALAHPGIAPVVPAIDQATGLLGVGLRVADLSAGLEALSTGGTRPGAFSVTDGEGRSLCDMALLSLGGEPAARIGLVQYVRPAAEALAAVGAIAEHAFTLKRLDHLAAIAPDLEATTRVWTETLGVPVWGEIATPTTIIRQMKMGDAILELLGPASADSTMRQRPPGLISMVAVEVPELEAAVKQARAAGFSPPDPATGVLPGTRTATIPAAELGGVALQLLEYV